MMATMDSTWTTVGGSSVYYRKAGGKLEMTYSSPAIRGAIAVLVISSFTEIVLLLTGSIVASIVILILLIIPPACSLPWVPSMNYMIMNTNSGDLQFLKRNIGQRVISLENFNISDIKDIIVRAITTGESTRYVTELKFKDRTAKCIHSGNSLTMERAIQDMLQSHIKNTVVGKAHLQSDDIMTPIEPNVLTSRTNQPAPHVANPALAFTCTIDHSEIEGLVYACPACHALLCNACMRVYLTRALGCPQCGRIVRQSEASNETRLLEIVDGHDDEDEKLH